MQIPLAVKVLDQQLLLLGENGSLAVLDPASGASVWQVALGESITAGIGSDGSVTAVVTKRNELLAFAPRGRLLWRQHLSAQSYTAPLVAGERVFVLGADRSVSAFDGASGRRLWTHQTRAAEPLVLRQPGVLLAVEDTLVFGAAGRLVGLNPLNGSVRWEAPLATPRGTNDVERLVDLVGPASRQESTVCARAFQAAVGCVNTVLGSVLWSRAANGFQGVQADESLVYGTENDGKVLAWQRRTGERVWINERLLHRSLSAPLLIGAALVVADSQGQVYWLARNDGHLLATAQTDDSGLAAPLVQANGAVVVVTRKGAAYALQLR